VIVRMNPSRSDALVFFGSTGDLAFKQIFPALQALVRHGRLDMPIIAVGRKDLDVDELRARAKESISKSGSFDAATFAKLAALIRYVKVDYDDAATFSAIKDALGSAKHPLHYVALPPEVFEQVATNLAKAGLNDGARLSLEKPFGSDGASAKALSASLHRYFPEEAIFRIDHYIGKESVENLIYFRAANPLIEASFRRDYVQSIEITMAEAFGVKGRARFYDAVGAVRDVVQNHLLEVIACIAMEIPAERGHLGLRAERSRLLAQIRALSAADIVRGQARGYDKEEGVARGSTTETFAALRLFVDSPRWQGVPIFIRTGKSLPVTATEAILRWKQPDHPVLEEQAAPLPNYVRFRIGPDNAIAIGANVKKDGRAMVGERKELILRRTGPEETKPYERLIGDAIDGDPTMFAERVAVEESWRVVDPILGKSEVFSYDPGSWGPAEASRIQPEGGWSNPE
jgi:glucose-6-phosphate 1-dehydrogenase